MLLQSGAGKTHPPGPHPHHCPLTHRHCHPTPHVQPKDATVTFKDIAGIDQVKAEIMEIVSFLRNPQKFLDLGARNRRCPGRLAWRAACGPPRHRQDAAGKGDCRGGGRALLLNWWVGVGVVGWVVVDGSVGCVGCKMQVGGACAQM